MTYTSTFRYEDLSEIVRRLTVAAIHKAGTLIRETELERIKMQAVVLLRTSEALEGSLESVQPLQRLGNLLTAKDEEFIKEFFKFVADVASIPAYLEQIGKLVDSVNMLRDQLKKEGLVFEFPEITKPPALEIAKLVTLPLIKGFLKGLTEA
jgi:hypothetical protein